MGGLGARKTLGPTLQAVFTVWGMTDRYGRYSKQSSS
jgi:hypothetical protein